MNSLYSFVIWDIRPEIFTSLPLPRWYGLMWGVGIMLSYELMQYIYRKESKTDKQFSRLVLFILLGTIIGARLGHILFYDPLYYWNNPWEILPIKIGDGVEITGLTGLASHGGAIGILIAMSLYVRRYGVNYLWLADRLVIVGALCGGFIRLGNLFNSEIYGLPTSVPWAFIFTNVDQYPRHPTQVYEALFYFLLFGLLFFGYKKGYFVGPNGIVLGWSLILLFTFRFVIEFLKVDQEVIDYGISINAGQLLSLPFIVIGIVLVGVKFARSKQELQL